MKKNLFIVCFMSLIAFSLIGCNKQSKNTESPSNDSRMNKIADHLYEITYDEDFNYNGVTLPEKMNFGGCSGIQNGKFRGRNYDWNYTNSDVCIIHATKTEKREHASVGVADLSFLSSNEDYEKMPFVTIDGINDAGICIQVNVMPYGENGLISHSETETDDLPGPSVVRYILDYADNIEEAISLIEEKDIYSEYEQAEEFHWMITGKASATDQSLKTIVVERFPDGYHITESFVDNKPIMTNLNVSNFDGTSASVGMGFGYERWQILKENFAQASSVMGTFDLMEKVFYSKFYDLFGDRFWYSEYALTNLNNYYTESELISLLGQENYDFYITNYGAVYYTQLLWDGETSIKGDISKAGIIAPVIRIAQEKYNEQLLDGGLWITVTTSVYDLENLSLDISVRESHDHYHFTID